MITNNYRNEDISINKKNKSSDKAAKELSDSSYTAKRKTDISEVSHTKTADKTPSRIEDKKAAGINISNITSPDNISKEKKRSRSPSISINNHKKNNSKSNNLNTKKKLKKRVNFKSDKNFIEVVPVESFKKYNIDNVYNEPGESEETTRCKCIIF